MASLEAPVIEIPMKPDISEFSYGFALTSELVSRFGLKTAGAPTFLTQPAEGKAGGGWDVKLPGLPVFLQFKRSDYLKTSIAKDYNWFRGPYYRFKLRARRHSQQHDLLLDFEAAGNLVLYAAPMFHTPTELGQAFTRSQVIKQSAFVSPMKIGPILDLKEHSLSFAPGNPVGLRHSEPFEVQLVDPFDEFDTGIRRRLRAAGEPVGTTSFRELGNELLDLFASRQNAEVAEAIRHLRDISADRNPADYAHSVARTLFDCELLIGAGSTT